MGAATYAGSLSFTDAEGVAHVSSQAFSLNFENNVESVLEATGSGTINVPFGTITTAKVITVETLLGSVEARYSGMASGVMQNVDGATILGNVAVTGVALRHTDSVKVKTVILGDP